LDHYGVSVPETRAVVRATLSGQGLNHDEIIELARSLWVPSRTAIDLPRATRESAPVHERRVAATMVLFQSKDRLDAGDADVVEGLLREAKTWALVDPLAGERSGPLSEKEDGVDTGEDRRGRDGGH